jgi:serine/threonine-protein kinase RIO1
LEFIGDEHPAMKIKDDLPEKKDDIKRLFDKVVENMRRLYQGGLVHADLSEYNILNSHGEPVFIDFSQSMPAETPNAMEHLERDVHNICKFFGKRIITDEKSVLATMLKP